MSVDLGPEGTVRERDLTLLVDRAQLRSDLPPVAFIEGLLQGQFVS